MFRTSLATRPAGPFRGPMVVSMRPYAPAEAIRAIQITSRFPTMHGAPVHIGMPDVIGIRDLARPDYGAPVEVDAGELPFCITHYPGAMLMTDLRNAEISVF